MSSQPPPGCSRMRHAEFFRDVARQSWSALGGRQFPQNSAQLRTHWNRSKCCLPSVSGWTLRVQSRRCVPHAQRSAVGLIRLGLVYDWIPVAQLLWAEQFITIARQVSLPAQVALITQGSHLVRTFGFISYRYLQVLLERRRQNMRASQMKLCGAISPFGLAGGGR